MLADLLASGTNAHAAFGDQSATHVERQVIGWFTKLFGLPSSAGGLLVSSGSTANLTGLTTARDAMVPELLQDGGARRVRRASSTRRTKSTTPSTRRSA